MQVNLIFIIFLLTFSLQSKGQTKKDIRIIENNSIEIPTEVHIKEIRIKRRFLKQSTHTLIQKAKDST